MLIQFLAKKIKPVTKKIIYVTSKVKYMISKSLGVKIYLTFLVKDERSEAHRQISVRVDLFSNFAGRVASKIEDAQAIKHSIQKFLRPLRKIETH